MADLGAIEADVEFDFGVADALSGACDSAASAISGQAGTRAVAVNTGLTDFKGHFSELFRTNASIAAGDAAELGNRLGEVAKGVRRLAEEARKEQQRRETARAWKKEHDDRGLVEKGVDFLSGGDDPPVGPPAEEPSIPVSAPINRSRETPAPGGGGGGGGTSSARPSSLRTFASTSRGANSALSTKPSSLKAKFSSFQSLCKWGTLDASGVFVGFDKWLTANDEDVTWATMVADAFKAAGGEGEVSTLSNSAVSTALKAAGVNASRQDLVIDPPQAFGNPPTTGYADDPVNTATGNFVENETDLFFPGAAAGLLLARCYNSFNPSRGAFGLGWSSLADAGLVFDAAEGTGRFTLPDGRQIVFPRLGEGWDRAVGENLWLSAINEQAAGDQAAVDPAAGDRTALQVADSDGSWWRFAPGGTLLSYGNGPDDSGITVRLVRDQAGRLERLVHGRGRHIDLTWGTSGDEDRIVAASSSDGRTVSYSYDEAGRLTAASGPLGTRSYTWTDPDQTDGPGLLAAVVDADGVVEAENSYDDQGRVVRQRSPFGRLTRFAYLPGRVTVVSDEDGSRSNTWIADERGRLVGVVDAAEHRQSTSYDRFGNPVMLTERDGATTVHEYDDRGRRVRTVTPSGADLTFGYDELDRVTIVVAEQGAATEYSYDAEARNPSTLTDPEGGVTALAWQSGLLAQVTDPTGVVVRFGYDDHGDLKAVTDAAGNSARMERDGLGRVTAAITPSGQRTSYAYDLITGLLATRRDPDGATWRYEHTTAGRMVAVVDPTGARTSMEHGQHGEESRTVDPLGRAVTRHLDDLGNLAGVELPDGSSWRFAHDALSRLVATTDPTGGTWAAEYDRAGHLVATVDPTGVRRGVNLDQAEGQVRVDDSDGSATTGFDPLGRMTTVGQADGSAGVLVYDRCGRPVESLDPDGGLTLIKRDPSGRPIQVTSPTGATTHYEYDRCGRLAAVVNPLGARSGIDYDADGHPVRQTLPTGEVARTRYDACGRVVEHRRPGLGTLSFRYDLAGRVVETRDPRSGRRQFSYDAAGQLVAVTDGNGGTTSYTYDALGRAVAITNPAGGVTRREFDGMNRCVAETDPLGRTTRAGYDGAGRLVWQDDPDGHRTSWTYDAAGRPLAMALDGRTITSLTRDLRNRTVSIDDHTQEKPARHELEWNRRGQLVRRARDGRAVSWTYDADGHRTTMTTPDGSTTSYGCDRAGRLVSVDHPLLGRAVFDRDAAGRLVSATAGGLLQSWEHADGWVVAHTLTDGDGASRTVIDRDDDGRIAAIIRDTADGPMTSRYAYDGACQLIEARISGGPSAGDLSAGSVSRWRYDPAGRLVAESVDTATTEHVYDLAGQLLSTAAADGRRLTYAYDGSGRRTRSSDDAGRSREFGWGPTGHLATITDNTSEQAGRTTIHTDALGELASVNGSSATEYFWDTAAYAGAPVLVGDTPVVAAGAVTGIGSEWTAPGWRTNRTTGTDPWSPGAASRPGGSDANAGTGIGASGEVTIAGMEWMGARVYDPASRGFLSVDPLNPVTGSGWAGNPYAFAGNDPMHALDPRGLNPVTDAELQAYRDGNGIGGAVKAVGGALSTAAHAVGDWVGNNWEYIAGGAMVVAGGVLIATGVGGPAGMMLVSAGADTIIQKATTGDVNWGQVAISGAFGAWGGVGAAARLGVTSTVGRAVVGGMISGSASGATSGAYGYATGPGPHTAAGLARTTLSSGAAGGVTGGGLGAAGHGLDSAGRRLLTQAAPTPPIPTSAEARSLLGNPGDTVVLGRQPDTAVAEGWDGHAVLNTDNWSLDLNDEFIKGAIDYQRPIYVASPTQGNLIQTTGDYAGQPTIFARELDMLRQAGYTPDGDYLVPPR